MRDNTGLHCFVKDSPVSGSKRSFLLQSRYLPMEYSQHLVSPQQVVGRALQELLQKYNHNPASPAVGIVSLSGLLHSEEKTAFREIARQLCT